MTLRLRFARWLLLNVDRYLDRINSAIFGRAAQYIFHNAPDFGSAIFLEYLAARGMRIMTPDELAAQSLPDSLVASATESLRAVTGYDN
jgi:hypothetical protein